MQLHLDKKDILEKLCSVIIAAYVVTAMAFECTANTAKYSTLGIYAVFLIGVLYILVKRFIKLGGYAFSLYFMYAYILLRCHASGASQSMGQTIAYYYLTCAIVCYVVYYVTYCYPKLVNWLVWGIIIGALVLAYRIAQFYGGVSMMLEYASRPGGERRVGGDLINENQFGLYMANALLCCVLLASNLKRQERNYLLILAPCAMIFAAMGMMSGSKKAVVFMAAGICALLWLFSQKTDLNKRMLIYTSIIGTMVLIVYAIRTIPFFATISVRLDEFVSTLVGGEGAAKTDQNRMNMIIVGLDAFWENPIFGNGTGHSYIHFNTYSHNNYVELLMNYGLIGFGAYYIPYVALLFALLKRSKNSDKAAGYLLVYILLQLCLGIAWVNYYERVVQVIGAAAWGYVDHVKEKGMGFYET